MKTKVRIFKRSCRNWGQFSSARKYTVRVIESEDAVALARNICESYNKTRTPSQKSRGTKYEFEAV